MLNKYIEYTNLKNPNRKELENFIKTAIEKSVYGVVLRYQELSLAKKLLKNTDIKLISVAGFPPVSSIKTIESNPDKYGLLLGLYNKEQRKELHYILDEGVDELDIIFPFSWYIQGKLLRCRDFLAGIKKRVKFLKVIIELGTFVSKEIVLYEIISILKDSGVDMIKTNSGIIKRDFQTLTFLLSFYRDLLSLPIKASGEIRLKEEVEFLINLGVKRIGTSDINQIL